MTRANYTIKIPSQLQLLDQLTKNGQHHLLLLHFTYNNFSFLAFFDWQIKDGSSSSYSSIRAKPDKVNLCLL